MLKNLKQILVYNLLLNFSLNCCTAHLNSTKTPAVEQTRIVLAHPFHVNGKRFVIQDITYMEDIHANVSKVYEYIIMKEQLIEYSSRNNKDLYPICRDLDNFSKKGEGIIDPVDLEMYLKKVL